MCANKTIGVRLQYLKSFECFQTNSSYQIELFVLERNA